MRRFLLIAVVFVLPACFLAPGQGAGGNEGQLAVPTTSIAATPTQTLAAVTTTTPSAAPTTAAPTASPSASPSPSPSASPSPSPSPTPSATPQPTQQPTQEPTPPPATPTPQPTPTPTPRPTPTPTPTPSPTPSPSPSPTPSPTLPPNTPPTPPTSSIGAYGKVTDAATGAVLRGICVTLGQPGGFCWAITDSAGNYTIDGSAVGAGSQFQLYFFTCNVGVRSFDGRTCSSPSTGYPVQASDTFTLSGVIRKDWALHH